MLILYAILIASIGLTQVADASAIKGHARPLEEARSIKLAAPTTYNSEKFVKEKVQVQQVPILESTKKIYNDESIRRLVAQQPPVEHVAVVSQPKQLALAADASVQPAAVVVPSAVVAPQAVAAPLPLVPVKPVDLVAPQVVVQQAPVEQAKVAQPAVGFVDAKSSSNVVVEPKSSVVEPKSSVVVVVPKSGNAVVDPVVVAKPEELPPQSDRSAPIVVAASSEQVLAKERPVVPAQQVPVVESAAPSELVKDSTVLLQAKKEEVEPLAIEVPAPDPQLSLSDPIDSTTKLLIDLDEHVQKFLPVEEPNQLAQAQREQNGLVAGVDYSPSSGASAGAVEPSGKSAPLLPYSSSVADDPVVPPLPPLEGVEKASAVSGSAGSSSSASSQASAVAPSATRQGGQNQQNQQQVITQLLEQLDTLQNRIQDTMNQLVARRRYVMSALLRPMGTYVRRVRTNLERLQNRVNQLQAAAVSVGGGGGNRPGGFVDAAAIETIRRRIDDISKRISDIVNRIRFSLTPTSAPLNSNGRK